MNIGNKKKREFHWYRVTGLGWIVYTLGIVILLVEFKLYNEPAKYYVNYLNKRHCYNKEYNAKVKRDCQVLNITKDFSDVNDFKEPVYYVSYKDLETGKEFKEIQTEDPGKKGDTKEVYAKKGIFFGENVKKPKIDKNNNNSNMGWLVGIPVGSLFAVLFIFVFIVLGPGDERLSQVPAFIKRDTREEDTKELGWLVWSILYCLPVASMILTTLIIWIAL